MSDIENLNQTIQKQINIIKKNKMKNKLNLNMKMIKKKKK